MEYNIASHCIKTEIKGEFAITDFSVEDEEHKLDVSQLERVAEHVQKDIKVEFSSNQVPEDKPDELTEPNRESISATIVDIVSCQVNTEHIVDSEDWNISPLYDRKQVFCRKAYEPQNLLSNEHNTQKFSCDFCTKTFSKRRYLNIHVRTHTREKSATCDVFSKSFHERNEMSCDVCTKIFSRRSDLVKHMVTHRRIKSFRCDICTKNFTQSSLKIHLLTHSGEKPFSCDVCTKAFYMKAHLKRHLLTHTREKPFQCEICAIRFSQTSHLKTHLLGHTGEKSFYCDFCFKAFYKKSDLVRHMRSHTGEKPYACSMCNRAFSQKTSLQKHQLTHTKLESS